MRLLILLILSFDAFADNKVEGLIRLYDDGETQVISPHASVSTSLNGETVHVNAGYAMDIVSSASCDVKSWSSQEKITDTRREVSAGLDFSLEKGSMSLGYVQSDENDYSSKLVAVGSSKEFFEKNTVVDISLASGVDHIKSSFDRGFDQVMRHGTMSLGVTQILSKESLFQLLYDFRMENGYNASPYRVARIQQANGSVVGFPENHPLTRNRHTAALRYNLFMRPLALASATTLRGYMDSWGVKSGTIEQKFSREFGKSFSVSLIGRYYKQMEATFYKDKYDNYSAGAFVTGNKTLSRYSTILWGIRPTYRLGSWDFFLKYENYILNYENFTDVGVPSNPNDDKLYSLKAQIFGLGVGGTF